MTEDSKRGLRGWAQRLLGRDEAPTIVSPQAKTEAVWVGQDPRRLGHLMVVDGPVALHGIRFALAVGTTRIGRAEDCEVSVGEPSISRLHAVVEGLDDGLYLEHRSGTNPTFCNGEVVSERLQLFDGDELRLVERIRFRVDAPEFPRPSAADERRTLRAAMEDRVRLEAQIERDFVRTGSFVDIDVVDSYGMKTEEPRPERIVVSFERFRAFVEETIAEGGGQILNANGDEVMGFFPSADDAVHAACRFVASLPGFNEQKNELGRPFQARIGIHTGRSAVDLHSGIAYSPVLDHAGHLQKDAPIDGVLISVATREALASPVRLERVPAAGKRAEEAYVVLLDDSG